MFQWVFIRCLLSNCGLIGCGCCERVRWKVFRVFFRCCLRIGFRCVGLFLVVQVICLFMVNMLCSIFWVLSVVRIGFNVQFMVSICVLLLLVVNGSIILCFRVCLGNRLSRIFSVLENEVLYIGVVISRLLVWLICLVSVSIGGLLRWVCSRFLVGKFSIWWLVILML